MGKDRRKEGETGDKPETINWDFTLRKVPDFETAPDEEIENFLMSLDMLPEETRQQLLEELHGESPETPAEEESA